MWKTLKTSVEGDYRITRHPSREDCLISEAGERRLFVLADGHSGIRSAAAAALACRSAAEILLGDQTVPWPDQGVV